MNPYRISLWSNEYSIGTPVECRIISAKSFKGVKHTKAYKAMYLRYSTDPNILLINVELIEGDI